MNANSSVTAKTGIPFKTRGIERMRIDVSGNVGIGTAAPGYTLDVSGTIRSTGAIQGTNLTQYIVAWPYNPVCVSFNGYTRNAMEFVISEASWDLNNYMYIIRFSHHMQYNGGGGGSTNYLHYSINNTGESSAYNGRNLMSYHNVGGVSGAYSNAQDSTSRLIYAPNSIGLLSMGEVKVRKYAHPIGAGNVSRISVQAYHENSYSDINNAFYSFEGGTYESEYYINNWSVFSLTSFKLWIAGNSLFQCDANGVQTKFTCSLTKVPL